MPTCTQTLIRHQHTGREQGTVLVFGLLLSVLLMGITGALAGLNLHHQRHTWRETDHAAALNLAEAGIAAATRELVEQSEAEVDPTGILTAELGAGEYWVSITEETDGSYLLASTGTVGDQEVEVTSRVRVRIGSAFPPGAISILGNFKKAKVKFKKHNELMIDGNGRAALVFSNDHSLYEVADDFLKGLRERRIERDQVVGTRGTFLDPTQLKKGRKAPKLPDGTRDPNWHYLPFEVVDSLAGMDLDLVAYYEDLVAGAWVQAADALKVGVKLGSGADIFSYGTEHSPSVVHFQKKVHMKGNDRIEGHGILIVSEELKLQERSQLNWVGDVIVLSDEHHKAKVEIDGQFNVTGNLFVLGEGREDAEFKIKDDARSTITGNLFVGTHFDEKKSKKAKFEVDGQLTVNGILSFLGRKVEVKFKDTSDAAITGFMQMAVIDNIDPYELKLEFDGKAVIKRDLAAIYAATEALQRFSDKLAIPEAHRPLRTEIETIHWARTAQR